MLKLQFFLQVPLRMRIRLSWLANGSPVQDQGEISNFPPALWQWHHLCPHYPSQCTHLSTSSLFSSHIYISICSVPMSWTTPSFSLLRRTLSSGYPKMHPLSSPTCISFISGLVSSRGSSKSLISTCVFSYFWYAYLYSLVTIIFLKIFIYIILPRYLSCLSLLVGFLEWSATHFICIQISFLYPSYQEITHSPCSFPCTCSS